jgi:dihydrofolate synthase/folylpolyglutamate synthase
MKMTQKIFYNECLQTMYSLRRFGIKLGLSTIRQILKDLGNPQDKYASIHVAGTNGKGSVASTLASILSTAGYKTGLYTSPHLVRFNERITINNCPISDDRVVASYEAVKNVHHGNREPTFFEFTTAMALHEFDRQKVDWAVIETGMGGRLDATNIIKSALSIITNISLEHREYLGNSLAQIAREKGGIVKNGVAVVTGAKQKQVVTVIKEIAESKKAPLYRIGEHFRIRRDSSGKFTYFGMENTWRGLQTSLPGNHQIDNAALVLAACEILIKKKVGLPLQSIKAGLKKNIWPGRLEIVSRDPFILLDGAHNLIAARNLAKYLANNLAGHKITMVIGILNDKPYKAMLHAILPVCSQAILTRPKIDRGVDPETLYTIAKEVISNAAVIPEVEKAVNEAIKTRRANDVICIAGSLYVVGEAIEALGKLGFA